MRRMKTRRRAMRRAGACIAGCILMCTPTTPRPASAHLLPPDLPFYGPFTAGSVRCLRMISLATQRCFKRVLSLQRQCTDAVLTGQSCDTALVDAQIAAAKQTAQDVVAATCLGGQLTELSFSSLQEAQADSARACGDQAGATMSIAYGPAAAGLGASAAACMAQTATASQKLLRVTVRWRSRAFDRMATHLIGPSIKTAMMPRVDADTTAAAFVLAAHVGDACPTFDTVYGLDPLTLLTRLRSRADCIVNGSYVQSVVTCPTPVCGNGIKETGEQCDDGNSTSGDGCDSTCMAEPAPPRAWRGGG